MARLSKEIKLPHLYACRKCGRSYSPEEYEESRFCRSCGTYLLHESKVSRFLSKISRVVRGGTSEVRILPESYETREGQTEFIREATQAIKNKEVFLGSAPCGIGKSLASLIAVVPQLKENKLMICFRTRSQLHIYLKELKALPRNLAAVSFFSKQDMCPLRVRGNLSYFDFFEECKRLKDNCESLTKPYCRFYLHNTKAKEKAEELALNCAQKVLDPRESVRVMARRGFCAYEVLKKILSRVNVFLGTYHYVFDSKIREVILKTFETDLSRVYLIVDEAHNVPAFARELLSDRLTTNTLERALRETERFEHPSVASVREYLNRLMEEVFYSAQQTLRNEELKQLDPKEVGKLFWNQSGLDVAEVFQEYGDFVKEKRLQLGMERVLSYNSRVGEFLQNFLEKTETKYIHLMEKDQKGRVSLEVRSFDGREITDPVLRRSRGSILMSGFLSPPKVYRDLTLYDRHNVCLKEFNSPFPPENRLILVATEVSSEFKKRTSKMLEKWKNYIEAISVANEGNMGVFFTSYSLMHQVVPLIRITRSKIVEQHKTKRNDVVKQLARASDIALFGVMGGKLSEGIDYPNNALTCAVAVGLPYATWNIYEKALINYLEYQFPGNGRTYAYLSPAMLRLIQTCGRVHRSPNDKGCIVILDGRVGSHRIASQLPAYYRKEMKIVSKTSRCADMIKEFWMSVHKDQGLSVSKR